MDPGSLIIVIVALLVIGFLLVILGKGRLLFDVMVLLSLLFILLLLW